MGPAEYAVWTGSPGPSGLLGRERSAARASGRSARMPVSPSGRRSVQCLLQLDETREPELGVGDARGPDRHLLAVLPLHDQARDQVDALLHGMGVGIVLAVELHPADRADIVRLLERRHQLVRISRAGPLDRLGD